MNIFKIESQSSGFFAIIHLTIKKELLSKMIKSLRISCIFFILISFLTFLLNCSQFKQNNPIASNGIIDLSTWNPNIESINLKGNWEFCWDQWIPPNAEESQWKENCNGFYPVPAYWKFYNIPGKNLSPFGKATYRLKVILPTSFHDSYGIRWTEILSAFQIFINNKSVAQIGVLGTDFNTMTPKLKPDRTEIGPQNNQMTIVIWVSNFNHQNHGFWQPIYLGKWEIIRNTQVSHLMMDIASFASVALIGFYHLVLFLFRTRSKEYLFFGLFCISMGIRQLSVEDHAFIIFFPDIDFDFYIRFIYFTVLSIGIFMCMFIKSLFPEEVSSFFINSAIGVFGCSSFTLALPVRVFTEFFSIIFVLISFLPLGLTTYLFKAHKMKRKGATLILIAYLIFSTVVLNDILFTLGYISTGYISYIGITVFIFFQAGVLAQQLTQAFNHSEDLALELKSTLQENIETHNELLALKELQNTNLEFQVQSRTRELLKARDDAEFANKVKSQFLASMSHEIRTPLNGIIGLIEQFKSTPLDENQQYIRNLIQKSGENLLKIINDILDFSKLEEDKINLELHEFYWKETVEETIGIFLYQATQKGLVLSVDYSPDFIDKSVGDKRRITQVLSNLISNAVKFTDSGKIQIRAFSEKIETKIEYKIQVIDSGIGIPREKIDLLFQKFFQLDSSISRKYGGTGLGLAISKKLVELMNGKIHVSQNKSKGSTFEFTVLLSEFVSKDHSTYLPEITDLSSLSPDTFILIAEDDSTNIFLLSGILKKLKIKFELAKDGLEAITKVRVSRFDLIFMDINMPHLDGISASNFILTDPMISPKPVIIAVTADVLQEDKIKCRQAGMSDFLGKPYYKKDIEQMIYKWLVIH